MEAIHCSIRYIIEFLDIIGLMNSDSLDPDAHERLKKEGELDKLKFWQEKLKNFNTALI